jgi:hypothetical protein
MIVRFHRFSIIVWSVWLVPTIGGMVLGASELKRGRPCHQSHVSRFERNSMNWANRLATLLT